MSALLAGAGPELEPLLRVVLAGDRRADLSRLGRAHQAAEKCCRLRLGSGGPSITHLLSVAAIPAELGMDMPTLCASLLRGAVEETDDSLDMLRRDFGETVALLVGSSAVRRRSSKILGVFPRRGRMDRLPER